MSENQRDIRVEQTENNHYLLTGILSFDTVSQLQDEIETLTKQGTEIVLDLAGISRVDSAGLVILLEWMKLARESGKQIFFTHIPPQLMDIARVSDLDSILPLYKK
ncbi:MAG: STAS domain-containing protein [Gammaproteobacteria bacterium]|nr:STAS domain-containing protein [Gammaproteobacteria bacterium]MDH5614382.1 STAS domain-containing protein [Gammaproteobacteria bacterium]